MRCVRSASSTRARTREIPACGPTHACVRAQAGPRVGPYDLLQTLGGGSEGIVKLAVHRRTLVRRAMKIIARGNAARMARVDTQVQAMARVQHAHIVRLMAVLESDTHVFLVMELCAGGSLYDLLQRRADRRLTEPEARGCFRPLAAAVAHCHERGVCHRDLRLENGTTAGME